MKYQIYIDDECLPQKFSIEHVLIWLGILRRQFPGHPVYAFEVR